MKSKKVTARQVKESVEWLLKEQCGCCHYLINYTSLFEVDAVIGWHKTEVDDPDTPAREIKCGNSTFWTHPTKEAWIVAWKIGIQSFNNAMQTDMDIDFQSPWNEDGDCLGGETEICGEHDKGITFKAASAIAKEINEEAMRILKIQRELERDNEGSGKAA